MEVETTVGTPGAVEAETLNRPAAVLEAFVRCIESGEVEGAIALLSESVVEGVGYGKLESIFSSSALDIWSLGGIEGVEMRTLAFSRDHVEMQLTIWYGDHKAENEVVDLVREYGLWKVSLEEVNLIAVDPLQ